MSKAENFVGKKFFRLLVIQSVGKDKHYKLLEEVLCDCGVKKVVRRTDLIAKKIKSCGCYSKEMAVSNRNDLTGRIFNRLTVKSYSHTDKNRKPYYTVVCKCGVIKKVSGRALLCGDTQSCGCLHRKLVRTQAHVNKVYRNAERRASRLKRTPKWADLKVISNFYRNCPSTMHVDHIIPLKGKLISGLHVQDNLQYLDSSNNLKKGNKFVPFTQQTTSEGLIISEII